MSTRALSMKICLSNQRLSLDDRFLANPRFKKKISSEFIVLICKKKINYTSVFIFTATLIQLQAIKRYNERRYKLIKEKCMFPKKLKLNTFEIIFQEIFAVLRLSCSPMYCI